MAKKCKHSVLLRVDSNLKPVERNTPHSNVTPHFQCEDCGIMFLSMMSSKPILIEQVALS